MESYCETLNAVGDYVHKQNGFRDDFSVTW